MRKVRDQAVFQAGSCSLAWRPLTGTEDADVPLKEVHLVVLKQPPGVPELLSRNLVLQVARGSFCTDEGPWGNGWTPPVTLLQSTRQLVAAEISLLPSDIRNKTMKSCVFCSWNPFGLLQCCPTGSLEQIISAVCKYPLQRPCWTSETTFPERLPGRMVLALLVLPHGYHQKDIPGPHPAAGRNHQEANA